MIKLRQIHIQGFKSFQKNQILDLFHVDPGLFFVTGKNHIDPELGSNGVGKSSIFDALCWVLFGKTSRKLSAGSVANWNSKHDCVVCLGFRKGNKEYILRRTWKPNFLELSEFSSSGVEEVVLGTQEELEEFLGLNFESFLNAVFVSQYSDSFFHLRPAEKMKIFNKIIEDELEVWEKLGLEAQNKHRVLQRQIEDKNKEIAFKEGEYSSIEQEDYKQLKENWEQQQKEKAEEFSLLIEKEEKLIQDYDEQSIVLKDEVKKYNKELDKIEAQYGELNKKELELLEIEKKIKNQLVQDEIEWKIVKGNLGKLKETQSKGYSTCPTCYQIVDKKLLDATENSMVIEEELLIKVKNEMQDKLDKAEKATKGISNQIDVVDKQYREISDNKLHKVERKQEQISKDTKDSETKIKRYRKDIENISMESNPFVELEKQKHDKKVLIQEEIEIHKADLLELERDATIYQYWHKEGSKLIKLEMIENTLKELEVGINSYAQQLGLSNWKISMEIGRETKTGNFKDELSVTVNSLETDKRVPLECYSGGENGRLMLAATLGLMDLIQIRSGIFWDIELWDEPTKWLGQEGVEALLEILAERAQTYEKRILIANPSDFDVRGIFDATIQVDKYQDGSKITGP